MGFYTSPSFFMALPMTGNGKLDRRALTEKK